MLQTHFLRLCPFLHKPSARLLFSNDPNSTSGGTRPLFTRPSIIKDQPAILQYIRKLQTFSPYDTTLSLTISASSWFVLGLTQSHKKEDGNVDASIPHIPHVPVSCPTTLLQLQGCPKSFIQYYPVQTKSKYARRCFNSHIVELPSFRRTMK